ncbi:hypothetical protein CPBF367_29600 [Xanthomonas arboricola pv. juglandis]|nr:hypothetical protein CPBF367_29600 [Xanthomonas arboricola pv. juglandis]
MRNAYEYGARNNRSILVDNHIQPILALPDIPVVLSLLQVVLHIGAYPL